ncbi:hypothetical protein L249_1439 [Ophiocordyceps polyrhachis-furcata BCC 54312]|uniref:Uncharacterized protein n=1 Tax=Ophiocordyceps polyrhachis-furcata BCC 54312 TaxID=1330021 RepID=A0A367L513_9HYPO|nr:hypothetical protein L249_1439 [Ophiocordyceps polyrhachis-furcata BCC 54312]
MDLVRLPMTFVFPCKFPCKENMLSDSYSTQGYYSLLPSIAKVEIGSKAFTSLLPAPTPVSLDLEFSAKRETIGNFYRVSLPLPCLLLTETNSLCSQFLWAFSPYRCMLESRARMVPPKATDLEGFLLQGPVIEDTRLSRSYHYLVGDGNFPLNTCRMENIVPGHTISSTLLHWDESIHPQCQGQNHGLRQLHKKTPRTCCSMSSRSNAVEFSIKPFFYFTMKLTDSKQMPPFVNTRLFPTEGKPTGLPPFGLTIQLGHGAVPRGNKNRKELEGWFGSWASFQPTSADDDEFYTPALLLSTVAQ